MCKFLNKILTILYIYSKLLKKSAIYTVFLHEKGFMYHGNVRITSEITKHYESIDK